METKTKQTALQVYSSGENFELAQRIGQSLMKSELVPKVYQNNLPNVLIALEMASRIGASPLMVMQHLNIIQGRPSWSSTFIISAINSCGRFSPLQYRMKGSGMELSCIAFAKDKDGNVLESPEITMRMAKSEGWLDKSGSKWKTMPELMIRYRAAAFWGRLYAPEITMGMQSAEEVIDVVAKEINPLLTDEFENEDGTQVQDANVVNDTTNGISETPVTDELFPKK
jgi:hypothetical protein